MIFQARHLHPSQRRHFALGLRNVILQDLAPSLRESFRRRETTLHERTLIRKQIRMSDDHINEDLLEQYALHRLKDDGVITSIEEHLLVCKWCQDRLEQIELMRTALPERIYDVDDSGT